MNTNLQFIKKSSNKKLGKIPATTSPRQTCPPSCPLIGKGGCYGDSGFHTRLNWDKVDAGERGQEYSQAMSEINKLPDGQLWRHNVVGDLQGANDRIDGRALKQLTAANRGKRGFTYTHYPVVGNRLKIQTANANGFTVNISANNPVQARQIKAKYPQLPVVTVVPDNFWHDGQNRQQNIVRCPAETSERITCSTCKLCQVSDRKDIVGFTVHGARKNAANIIASAS